MSPEMLLQQFDVMAEAPNGVQKLREMILQLAVRGKLVPQDPSDEPACLLLDRIAAEKQRLYTKVKISKPMPAPSLSEDEVPFAVPEGWQWTRVEALTSKLGSGSTPRGGKQVYTQTGVKFLRSQNVWNKGLRLGDVAHVPANVHRQMSGTAIEPGDVLLNITGASIGRSAVVPDDFDEGNVSQHVSIVRPVDRETRRFLHICFIAPFFQSFIYQAQVGISREGLSKARLAELPVPLPPLPEQRRIAAKVDELMALCDELEARQQRRVLLRTRLNRSALHHLTAATDNADLAEHWQRLHENFDLLYDTPETVAELRQSVLQLAVRGKLVPFDATSAMWPLGNILAENSLNGISTKPSDDPTGTPILRISAGTSRQDALVDELEYKYLDIDAETIEKFRLVPGDLLACRFNGNLHYVGRLSLYTGYSGTTQVYPDKLIRFRVKREQADPAYIRYAFNAPETRQRVEAFCATTVGNIGISAGQLKNINIPVPSLGTQRRIVAKVDQLMALCDQMEARLTSARDKAEHLAASVVHHVAAA